MNNYPPGAEHDPNAPYNQPEHPEADVDVCISQTLSKSKVCCTTDFIPGCRYAEKSYEDGELTVETVEEPNDFSDTDFAQVAEDNEFFTPLRIIEEFKSLLLTLQYKKKVSDYYIRKWLEQCEGWTDDETEVIQN